MLVDHNIKLLLIDNNLFMSYIVKMYGENSNPSLILQFLPPKIPTIISCTNIVVSIYLLYDIYLFIYSFIFFTPPTLMVI